MQKRFLLHVVVVFTLFSLQGAVHADGEPIETAQDEVDAMIDYLRATEPDPDQVELLNTLLGRVRQSSMTASASFEASCYRAGCFVIFAAKEASDLRRLSAASKLALKKWNGVKLWAPIGVQREARLVVALVGSLG